MNLPTYLTGIVQTQAYAMLRENVYIVLRKYEITPTHWGMLGIIIDAKDGIRQAEVARTMGVKPPLITVMVRELDKRGIVATVPNQFDARAKLLSVTPAGKKFVKTIELELRKQLDLLLTGLNEDDLIAYYKVLSTIVTNGTRIKITGV